MEFTEKYAILTNVLTKKFGAITAVKDLNLKIPYGVTYGLLGPNDASKKKKIKRKKNI
ncbi:MAG: hypothetical protein ACFFDB_06025 [Promethearchaeota archaeon]